MKLLQSLKILLPITLFVACSQPTGKEENKKGSTEASASAEVDESNDIGSASEFQLDLIIANNIASPVKLLTDINDAGMVNYQDDVTNPPNKAKDYVTSEEMALNFGIYGADLSYKSLYGRHQEMADYLIAIRSLSDQLGLTSLFDQKSLEQFERIKSNPDSVKLFIFEKYDQADEYLRTNERMMTAALVLTGGLIESLHLVSRQIEVGEADEEAYTIFINQKNTLKNLLDLFNTLEQEGQEVAIRQEIQLLYDQFDEIDNADKFSKENIESLHVSINEIRAKLI